MKKSMGKIPAGKGESPGGDLAVGLEYRRGADHPPAAAARLRRRRRRRQDIHQKSHDSHIRTERVQGEDGLFAEEEVYQRPGCLHYPERPAVSISLLPSHGWQIGVLSAELLPLGSVVLVVIVAVVDIIVVLLVFGQRPRRGR